MWKTDAEEKWSNLKRASEAAAMEAEVCRQSGDAAGRELASLKSAFRSFLKTLWEDLRPRLPFVSAAGIVFPARDLLDRDRGVVRPPDAPPSIVNTSEAPKTTDGFRLDIEDQQQVVEGVISAPGPTSGAQADTIAELTETEILDIMQDLSDTDPLEPFFMSTTQERTLAPPSGGATSEPCQRNRRYNTGDSDVSYGKLIEGLQYGLETRNASTALGDTLRSLHLEGLSGGRSGVTQEAYSMSPHLPLPPPCLPMAETGVTSACINDRQVLSSSKGSDALKRWSREAGEILGTSETGDPFEQARSTVTEAMSTSPRGEMRDAIDS